MHIINFINNPYLASWTKLLQALSVKADLRVAAKHLNLLLLTKLNMITDN